MKNLIVSLFVCLSLPAFAGTHKVTYEIPVPDALEPYSRIEVEYTATKRADGTTELVYQLPKTLLGRETEFRFEGIVDFSKEHFDFRAENARMRCQPEASHASCRVGYSGVQVDLYGVTEALDALPLSPAEKLGRFEIASMIARAGGDFAGILRFIRDPEYLSRP